MKGSNKLVLNQATICEAVQVWLDKTLASGHGQKVTAVTQERNSSNYTGAEFEVTIAEEATVAA